MTERTVSLIFGTRPEAIKLGPVIHELRRCATVRVDVCVTAQHRELLDQVLDVFAIEPDHDLDLMQPGQTLGGFMARAIAALDGYLARVRPAAVLVQGDTSTVFAAALCAFYHGALVGHVEAGLRTFDKRAPYPEELNRVLTTRVADLHFAPTAAARDNLLLEGVPQGAIHVTGNTVVDALELARARVRREPPPIPGLPVELLANPDRALVLITGHRRESFGERFESICQALAILAGRFPAVSFVYPIHLNPRVREPVFRVLGGLANVHVLEPLGYLAFVALMERATVILTDSGGIQEEAPSLGKPVLVLRDTTERPEAIAAGSARLVGTDARAIVGAVEELLGDPAARAAMSIPANPYGDGRSSARIVEILLDRLAVAR